MTDHPPPSKDPVAPALASEDELRSDAKPEFDPYKFSKVTVPPDLRRQMVQANLPRLEAEFFHDTLPPNRQPLRKLEDSPDSARLALREDLPPRRRPLKLVIACVFGALLLLALGLLKARTEQSGPTSTTADASPRPSSHVTLEAAVPARTTASALHGGAARAVNPTSVGSAIAPPTAGHAPLPDKRAPRIGASVSSHPKPPIADQSQKSETDATPAPTSIASAAVPVSAPPPAPVIPKPVQTSWFSPK